MKIHLHFIFFFAFAFVIDFLLNHSLLCFILIFLQILILKDLLRQVFTYQKLGCILKAFTILLKKKKNKYKSIRIFFQIFIYDAISNFRFKILIKSFGRICKKMSSEIFINVFFTRSLR